MKCKCDQDMNLESAWADLNIGISFILYLCNHCGTICRQDMWENAGSTWLTHEAFKTFAKLSKQVLDS